MIDGTALRKARRAAQVTQAEMAGHARVSQGQISRVENGERPVTPALITLYEKVCGTTFEDMDRRAVLAGLSLGSLSALLGEPVAANVGRSDVDAVRALTDTYTQLDLSKGGAAVAHAGRESVRWAVRLLEAKPASAAVRAELHGAVAALVDRVGWSINDAGEASPRQRLGMLNLADQIAAESDDPTLRAHIRLNRASALGDHGHHVDAARLLEDTLAQADGVAAVEVANLHAVVGRCWARSGDRQAAVRHARRAEELYVRAETGDVPPWASRMLGDPGHVFAVIGRTWLVAGQYTHASEALTAASDRYAADRTRGRVGCLARRAHARLALGDIDGCDQDISDATRLCGGIDSVRTAYALRRVQQLRALRV